MSKTFKALERAEKERRIGTGDSRDGGTAPFTLVPFPIPGPSFQRQAVSFDRSALGRCRSDRPAILIYSLDEETLASRWALDCAISLTVREKKKILLVEASLNAPTLHRICHIPPSPGILDILAGREPQIHAIPIIQSDHTVSVVTLDERLPQEERKSGIEKWGEWVNRQRSGYDWIWLCASGPEDAPLLTGLLPWSDGVLLLISHRTKPARAETFCKSIRKDGTYILGTVYLEGV